jgi:glycosyltransferase involved in cell wall biosynthesis
MVTDRRVSLKTVQLAIVSTHPIQYYAPVFRALARSKAVRPKVFYTWSQTASESVIDPGFERRITWDVPLLEGYEFAFVRNTARQPGTHHFKGICNPGLIGAIQDWGADAVLVFGWNLHSHLGALRYFKGRLPVFFRGDSTLLDNRGALKIALRRGVLGWIYRHVDIAIAVGSNNFDYYRWCGLPPQRIPFAPHAIDTSRFADPDGSQASRAARWREELGIPAAARTVVFAGKLQPKKDPLLMLEAFSRCGTPGHLVFVGNGELEQQVRARAQGREDVHFLPFQNQSAMPAVYRLGDVFALPSRGPGETWGLALNEAMACGRPVIAGSKVGGARDLVAADINGWVFESGNVEQLATILRKALTCDATVLAAMAVAAERESARWSVEAAAAGIQEAVLRFGAERGVAPLTSP